MKKKYCEAKKIFEKTPTRPKATLSHFLGWLSATLVASLKRRQLSRWFIPKFWRNKIFSIVEPQNSNYDNFLPDKCSPSKFRTDTQKFLLPVLVVMQRDAFFEDGKNVKTPPEKIWARNHHFISFLRTELSGKNCHEQNIPPYANNKGLLQLEGVESGKQNWSKWLWNWFEKPKTNDKDSDQKNC